ncbi:short subunit dehydrogenase [Promicromonospora sp. AC04]|uniref:SDR family NAD(P)-dependent oxidoreductase n=1 Tax=Promicromonospora sp. AC04 TaxID=2135723 RepID=UPI000D37BB4D|nr:SDR family NAD(P)-dependent oxidoreductase [Promicromonospora sp. AC04]PUB32012.1 short subunit dehydrogenase [Promicromonospora sp. AC04]
MPTIAIVGAGPGLGLSIAKVFGSHGFSVALVARTQAKLDDLAAQLAEQGIEAAGFAADILDAESVRAAFAGIVERFGQVDVLEFSPAVHAAVPGFEMSGVLETTPDTVRPQIDFYLNGALRAAHQVLPAMLERGAGTLLFTTGGGSVTPIPMMGNINAAAAALRNWVLNLHQAAAERGVYAAHVAISAWIGSGPPDAEADAIARVYWELYEQRTDAERHYVALPPA